MPPNAPTGNCLSFSFAAVAFFAVFSYTHCGAAAVRCVG
jgi:hypothetical protein